MSAEVWSSDLATEYRQMAGGRHLPRHGTLALSGGSAAWPGHRLRRFSSHMDRVSAEVHDDAPGFCGETRTAKCEDQKTAVPFYRNLMKPCSSVWPKLCNAPCKVVFHCEHIRTTRIQYTSSLPWGVIIVIMTHHSRLGVDSRGKHEAVLSSDTKFIHQDIKRRSVIFGFAM